MDVQWLLLGGQLLVVVLVYVFVWRVLRGARQDLLKAGTTRSGAASVGAQESTIIPAADVQAARRSAGLAQPRLVVESSDVLRPGIPFTIGSGLTIGRTTDNDVVLDEGVVSGRHARVVAPSTLVDDGSTNGTLVNGQPVGGRARLHDGDRVQVGSTVFRFEVNG